MAELYEKPLSRQHPGLFIILIDQSKSMGEAIATAPGQQITKALLASSAVNTLIHEMIGKAKVDPITKQLYKYAYLSIFGYGSTVDGLLDPNGEPWDIAFLNTHYQSIEKVQQGSLVEQRRTWISDKADGRTEMAKALARAGEVINTWLNSPPDPNEPRQRARVDSFPPVIINITDGAHYGEGDPLSTARQVTSLKTMHGNVLLYNCHFTNTLQKAIIFPNSLAEVASRDPNCAQLFNMSSEIPLSLLKNVGRIAPGRDIPGARGMIFNSDASLLVKFIQWGSLGTADIR